MYYRFVEKSTLRQPCACGLRNSNKVYEIQHHVLEFSGGKSLGHLKRVDELTHYICIIA